MPVGGLAPTETVHALSLVADLAHGEILMPLLGSNLVAVMDVADGTLRRTIDVGALGCRRFLRDRAPRRADLGVVAG